MNYGWVVVGAIVVTTALSVALAGPALSFFIAPMQADLGIPMLYFGLAMSTRQLGFAIMSPLLGQWTDRFGARVLLMAVGTLTGIVVFSLSYVTTGWHLVLLLGLLGCIGLQGAGGDLYGTVAIAKWFTQQRAKAMSIAFIGMPLGTFFLMPLTQYCIDNYGWQVSWQLFGVVGGVIFVIAASFVRSPPVEPTTSEDPASDSPIELQWTREQATRHPAFWKLAISFGILMFTISTVAIYRVPHFIHQGIDPAYIAIAFSLEAVVGALTAIPMGFLISRFPIHYLTAIAFTMPILMFLVTINATTTTELFIATAIFGVGGATNIILMNTIWPNYFGSMNVGAIRGLAMPITLGFAIVGAPVAGWVSDLTGSFAPIWWGATFAMIVAIAIVLKTPKPVLDLK